MTRLLLLSSCLAFQVAFGAPMDFQFSKAKAVRVDFPEHRSPSITLHISLRNGKLPKHNCILSFLSHGHLTEALRIPLKAYELLGQDLELALKASKNEPDQCLNFAVVTWKPIRGEPRKRFICWENPRSPAYVRLATWQMNATLLKTKR